MNYVDTFIYDISLLLFIFLSLQSGYLFLFALAGRLASLRKYNHAEQHGSFIIYLFCDNEDEITEAAKAVASLCYSSEKKQLFIIANSLSEETIQTLQDIPVQIAGLMHNTHSKTRALQMALAQTKGNFDFALLLHAKHICTKGFLYRMNDALQSGFGAVQGQRIVKHTASAFALLNAISESVDTHIFCKSHQVLGLSSSITDSGVGIQYSLFRHIMPLLPHNGNLDKELELHLLREHIHFGYAPKACLYEDRKSNYNNDRKKYNRWATGKSRSLNLYLSDGISELYKGNADFLDKIFQNLLLPRILLLGITPLAVLISFLNLPVLSSGYWIILWAVTYVTIFMSMPAKYITNRFLRAIFFLPLSFVSMMTIFLKRKKSNNQTVYSYTIL